MLSANQQPDVAFLANKLVPQSGNYFAGSEGNPNLLCDSESFVKRGLPLSFPLSVGLYPKSGCFDLEFAQFVRELPLHGRPLSLSPWENVCTHVLSIV